MKRDEIKVGDILKICSKLPELASVTGRLCKVIEIDDSAYKYSIHVQLEDEKEEDPGLYAADELISTSRSEKLEAKLKGL